MQCPPTKPGLKGRKFHLVPAAAKTACVSICIKLNILANSLTKAILISRWEFSMTLAASATFMDGAKCVPAVITDWYNSLTCIPISGVDPEVIFKILSTVCSLSPGLIRSGEYPTKKSTLNCNPENFSKTGTHSSSVAPGYTVDS